MWFTYAATRSSLEVAAIAVVFQLTYVAVGPAAGVFADRWDHRRTMIVCDGARAAILSAFALITWRAGFSFPLALVAVFLLESAGRFFGPSRLAYIPFLIERDDLATANGLFTGTRQAAGLGGQALAGLMISGVGALAGFVVDAVSFVLSGLALTLIRPPRAPEAGSPTVSSYPKTSRHGFWSELREGYQVLVGIPMIRALLLFAAFSNAAFAMIEPAMPAYIRTTLHSGAWAYGLVGSFQFGGTLLGGFLAGEIAARLRAGPLMVAATAFDGAALVAAGVVHVVPVALVLWGSWASALAVIGVVEQSLDQALIPRQHMARVMALMSSVGMALMPVGSLVGGLLAGRIGAASLYVFVGLGFVAMATAMLLHPTLRSTSVSGGGGTPDS